MEMMMITLSLVVKLQLVASGISLCITNHSIINGLKQQPFKKTELPHDVAIPLPDIYSKELKVGFCRGIYTSMFISELFTIAKRWEQLKCLRQMNK